MTRDDWRALTRRLRILAAKPQHHMTRIEHGGTLWSIAFGLGWPRMGLTCKPSIIRDRSPRARAADCMWEVQTYRLAARRFPGAAETYRRGMRAALAEARAIRLAASAFHALP